MDQTGSGSREQDVPAGDPVHMLKVCTICLATEGKLSPLRGHELAEAYELITGYAPQDEGFVQQALCVQCAQRLRNFENLQRQCKRARFVLRELMAEESVTTRHIEEARRELESDSVMDSSSEDDMAPLVYEDDSDAADDSMQSRPAAEDRANTVNEAKVKSCVVVLCDLYAARRRRGCACGSEGITQKKSFTAKKRRIRRKNKCNCFGIQY